MTTTWKPVCFTPGEDKTERLAVPGGWLYRVISFDGTSNERSSPVTMAFVPITSFTTDADYKEWKAAL